MDDRTKRIAVQFLETLAEEIGRDADTITTMTEFSKAVEFVFFACAKTLNLDAAGARSLVEVLGIDLERAMSDKVEGDSFLDLYLAICKAHGKRLGACGCCDSPFVVEIEKNDRDYEDMAGHEAHLRGLQCRPCENSGCYIKAKYDGAKLLCAECGKELEE